MNTAAFLLAIRKRALGPHSEGASIARARTFLRDHQRTAEGKMFARTVRAIVTGGGEFGANDIYLLSKESLNLAAALIQARMGDVYSAAEWQALAELCATDIP